MSNFLQMLPRRLPAALADYLAVTGSDEFQRQAVARRIYSALSREQQAETSQIVEQIVASVQQTGTGIGMVR